MTGADKERPPSLDDTVHPALGELPRPFRVTKDTYRVPSAPNATSAAKQRGGASSPAGKGMTVGAQVAPASKDMCRAHEKLGVSMRLATARFFGSSGLRARLGELWEAMSR